MQNAFSGCSNFFGNLKIPNSMKTISFESFSNCFSLNGTLTIPSSVEQIENYAFKGTIFEKIIFM